MKLPPPPTGGYDPAYFRQLNHLVQQLGNRAVTNEGGQTRLDGDIHGDGDATFNIGDGTFTVENDGTSLLEVDGTGAGTFSGDADSVDGYQGAELGVLAENETVTGAWTFSAQVTATGGAGFIARGGSGSWFEAHSTDDTALAFLRVKDSAGNTIALLRGSGLDGAGAGILDFIEANLYTFDNDVKVSAGDLEVTSGSISLPHSSSDDWSIRNSTGFRVRNETDGSDDFRITTTGRPFFERHNTTTDSANANMTTSGELRRSTSSLRYKTNVENLTLMEARNVVLNARPVTYNSALEGDDPGRRYVGFGAEEVAETDNRFVTYDEGGVPNYVTYDRLTGPLTALAADHEGRIARLEAQVEELTGA